MKQEVIYIYMNIYFINKGRLQWAPKEVDVFRQILAVHTLVAEPTEDLDSWLELVTLCRKENMFPLCENILRTLGAKIEPRVTSLSIASNSRDSYPSLLIPAQVAFIPYHH